MATMMPRLNSEARFDITIAGETNLDLILYGLPEDMPIERELLASGFEATLGGSSSILAHNLAKLGSKVGFVTQLGRDDLGSIALQRLRDAGVDISRVTFCHDKATGVTLLLPHGDRRHILTYLGVIDQMSTADLDVGYLSSSRHFHISSLFLQTGLQPGLPELLSTLKNSGLTLSLDTNDDPADQWGGVLDELLDLIDVLLPNEDEIKRITGKSSLEESLNVLKHRVPLIVVKCGARGAVVQQGNTRTSIEPPHVIPIDTIGAGDSFNAGFLHAYAKGQSATAAASLGTVTGSLSTLRPGGTEAFRDSTLVAEFLAQHPVT